MKILHGNNLVVSRNRLNEIISSFRGEIVHLNGKKLNMTDLKQAIESVSLFGQERLVVIENLFRRPESKEKKAIIDEIKNNKSANVLIWEGKKIDGRKLAAFSKDKKIEFKLASSIFTFLDSLIPGRKREAVKLFHDCLKQEPPEMIFYLLIRQIQLLIIAKNKGVSVLDKMAPWQKMKLVNQAKKFTMTNLLTIHRQLLIIDFEQKTGRTTFPLDAALDLMIIRYIE